MNQHLQDFARKFISDGLANLGDGENRTFRLMYARKNGNRSVEDSVAMPLPDVLKEMKPEQLDWAMHQVEVSLKKIRP